MQKVIIQGGKKLSGSVKISGAKNAALPILFAALLPNGKVTIDNAPRVWDVNTTVKLLQTFGAKAEQDGSVVTVDASNADNCKAPYELVKTMRASVIALAPLLARFRRAKVSLPGGCAIGARPVDQHIMALRKLGAELEIKHGYISASLPKKRFKGARITFDMATVGGTEQTLIAASVADGVTVLDNCAREPEVVDLANFLKAMGANIEGEGTPRIIIEGVSELTSCEYKIVPDRIETGTYMAAAAITGGDVLIEETSSDLVLPIIDKMMDAGVKIESTSGGTIRVQGPDRLLPVNVSTRPYPGFPTDMQAQFMAMMCVADGVSVITENIFENRFMHALELMRMGAEIKIEGNAAFVRGVQKLTAADVMATDLRASASLLLAGLVAEGETTVRRIYHLWRGYEKLVEKLSALGADVRPEQDDEF